MKPSKPPHASAVGDSPADRLDVRGTLCPVPVLRTAARVAKLPPGAVVEVLGDDPLMRLDLAAWCAREGHEVVVMAAGDGGLVRCVLRVRGGASAD